MTNPLNNLIAAQLSQIADACSLFGNTVEVTSNLAPPAGWTINSGSFGVPLSDTPDAASVFFVVFVNDSTQQIVINLASNEHVNYQYLQEVADGGAKLWDAIQSHVNAILPKLEAQFPGYQVSANGDGIGGGLAQTFALQNGLDGFGQNSFPIPATIASQLATQGLTVAQYQQHNTFSEVDVQNDPIVAAGTALNGSYLNTNTSPPMANPYFTQEQEALQKIGEPSVDLKEVAYHFLFGLPTLAYFLYQTHSIETIIADLQSGATGSGASSLATPQEIREALTKYASPALALTALQNAGWYFTQPGDTATLIASTISNGGISVNTISAQTLQNINSVFGLTLSDDPLNPIPVGTLVHVPASISYANAAPPGEAPAGQTWVLDPSSGKVYTVGASLDGHDSGALIIDRADFAGNYPTFAAGTYSNVSVQPNGTIDVTLIEGDPVTLGTLAISPSGSSTFTLTDGTVISVPGNASPQIANTLGATATPEAVLESYLQQLGATNADTAVALDAAHKTYLADGSEAATTFTFGNGTTITFDQGAYSYLNANASTISFDLTLVGETIGQVTLNTATGAGTVTLPASDENIQGYYSTTGAVINIPGGTNINLTAEAAGTSPIQALSDYLSALGTPMTPDQLSQTHFNYAHPAGTAYDINSGVRGDEFGAVPPGVNGSDVVTYGEYEELAPGAVITGESTVTNPATGEQDPAFNVLVVDNTDLSQDTITNIQELVAEPGGSPVVLTQAEYNEFQTIVSYVPVVVTDPGRYQGGEYMIADSWNGTTLIGTNNVGAQALIASQFGNDTLEAGNGAGAILVGGGGVDTMIGGAGGDTFIENTTVQLFSNGVWQGIFSPTLSAAGSVIEGQGGGNTLIADGNITQLSISGIQTLTTASASLSGIGGGSVTLTASQLNGFGSLIGGGSITAADSGTFSLAGKTTYSYNMTADDWGGTVLIGNDAANEILTASLFGNDTLIAGNGAGDTLVAGEGVDTMIGGTGGDTFVATDGLADGSVIQGTGSGNVLQGSGDISLASITGVQTLIVGSINPFFGFMNFNSGDVTLTSDQFNAFNTITGGGTLTAATGGTYNLTGKSVDHISMFAGSNDGTTLISNDVGSETLTASDLGNDTLIVSNSNGSTLDANGSSGNNTLTAGNGSYNDLNASSSFGDNVLTAGTGGGNTLDVSDSSGNNTLTSNDTANSLSSYLNANNSDGGNSLTAGDANSDYLNASGSGGDNTLTAGNGNNDTLTAASSFGDNNLTVGGGSNDDLDISNSGGDNTLTAGNGNNDTLNAYNSFGNNTLTAGNGNGDMLTAFGATGNDTFNAGTGSDTMVGGNGNNTYVFSGAGSGSDLIYNNDTGSNRSVIQFTAGVSPSQVALSQNNNDLVLSVGSETITVQNYFAGTGNDINAIQFADGTVWDQNYIQGHTPLFVNGSVSLTAAQFNAYSSITGSGTIFGTTGGTYDLGGKTTGAFNLFAESNDGTTLIGNDAGNEYLAASASGNDMLIAGNGSGDVLSAGGGNDTLLAGNGGDILETGSGIDTLIGGAGNDVFGIRATVASGTTIDGGAGLNTLEAGEFSPFVTSLSVDITNAAISNVQNLFTGNVTLTATEFNSFSSIRSINDLGFFAGPFLPNVVISAATAGTYSLAGVSADVFNMKALSSGGTTLIGNDANGERLFASASGNDTLIAGNGASDILGARFSTGNDTLTGGNGGDTFNLGNGTDTATGGTGNDIFNVGLGNATMTGGNGNNTYNFTGTSSTGTYVINDYHTDNGQSTLVFGANVLASQVVATRSGNDLVLTIGSDPITVQNYFGGADYQLAAIQFADGTSWDYATVASKVYAPALPQFEEVTGGGTLTQTDASDYALTVNLGPSDGVNPVTDNINLGALNAAQGLADALAGSFTTSGSSAFTLSGFDSFSGIDAGQADTNPMISFSSTAPGTYTETITLNATGSDPYGSVTTPSTETLTLTVNVGQNYTLTDPNGAITGGVGINVLATSLADISQATISGIQTLDALNNSYMFMAAAQLSGFSTVINENSLYGGPMSIEATTAGTYDLTGKTLTGGINLDASYTSANVTLIAGSYDTTLTSGPGVDTLIGGSGNDTFNLNYYSPVGTTITGGTGANTLVTAVGDISQDNITGIQTLDAQNDSTMFMTGAQLGEFSTIINENALSGPMAIEASTAGTYDLTGKTLTGGINLDASYTSANVTLIAGSYDTTLTSGPGVDALIGGSGNDIFNLNYYSPVGTTIIGGSDTNTLVTAVGDISQDTITGIQTLDAQNDSTIFMTGAQLGEFSTIINENALSGPMAIEASTAGTYDLTGKTLTGGINLDASYTSANVTLIAGSTDTTLTSGPGIDALIGGSGNDTFNLDYYSPVGTTIIGGSGTNTLVTAVGDISQDTITGIQTLDAQNDSTMFMTGAQLSEFSTIINENAPSGPMAIEATTAGTYDLTGKTLTGGINLDASYTSANVTLIAGSTDMTLTGGNGTDTLVAGTGNDMLNGGNGYTRYSLGQYFGQDVINNVADGGITSAKGEIDFGTGVSDQNLWFQKSGNDLQIDLLGTNSEVTVAGWFGGNAGAQVQSINAGGNTLTNNQLAQLVTAMATFGTANPGFNPTTATGMPTDTTLQTAIAANWHHA